MERIERDPRAIAATPRKPWVTPSVSKLDASAAEVGAGANTDGLYGS